MLAIETVHSCSAPGYLPPRHPLLRDARFQLAGLRHSVMDDGIAAEMLSPSQNSRDSGSIHWLKSRGIPAFLLAIVSSNSHEVRFDLMKEISFMAIRRLLCCAR
jgi:hypothetical protein